MSSVSENESLSLSRYGTGSDVASLQHFEQAPINTTQTKQVTFCETHTVPEGDRNAQSGHRPLSLPNPFAHEALQLELHSMFARAEYAPLPAATLLTLGGLALGAGLGAVLSQVNAPTAVVAWIGFPGQLYLDGLLCVVVPAAFCKVVVAVAEAVGNVTVRTIAVMSALWFSLTALLAAAVGTVVARLFQSTFATTTLVPVLTTLPQLAFQCESGQWLTTDAADGAVFCGTSNATDRHALFTVQQTTTFFTRRAKTAFASVSMTDQIVGILSNMVPANVLAGFVDNTYVSVVFTAFFFAIASVYGHDSRHGVPNYVLLLLTQTEVLLRMLLNVLLKFLPLAVVSIVASAIATNDSMTTVHVHDVVALTLALVTAAAVFLIVGMGAVLWLTTKCNVLRYFKHLLAAQAFALGAGSTIATLPMTIRCVDATGEVPRSLNRIVVALGATCNLTGMSLYTPVAVVFLAKISGLEHQLTAATYTHLWFLSAVAGYGAKTVESAEMVMVLTIWRAVFHTEPSEKLATLVVADWLFQRVRTLVNVTCHAVLARIVAEHCRDGRQHHHKDEVTIEFPGDDDFLRTPTHHF